MNPIPKLSEAGLKRFWSKVDQSGDCWLWTSGRRNRKGYGSFKLGGKAGRNYLAHHISYAITKGEPGDEAVCHSCDNDRCVNPDHLWTGTNLDNIQDRVIKGRSFCKLTIEQVREIFASRESQRTLGNQYGVSSITIHDIKAGLTWNRVTGLPKYIKGESMTLRLKQLKADMDLLVCDRESECDGCSNEAECDSLAERIIAEKKQSGYPGTLKTLISCWRKSDGGKNPRQNC